MTVISMLIAIILNLTNMTVLAKLDTKVMAKLALILMNVQGVFMTAILTKGRDLLIKSDHSRITKDALLRLIMVNRSLYQAVSILNPDIIVKQRHQKLLQQRHLTSKPMV